MNWFRKTLACAVGVGMGVLCSGAAEFSLEDKEDIAALSKFISALELTDDVNRGLGRAMERQTALLEKLHAYWAEDRMPWVRPTGPCGDETTFLGMYYLASILRDTMAGKQDDLLYRAWLVVIERYQFFRKASKDAPEGWELIPAIEEMIRDEKNGTLKARASIVMAKEAARMEQKGR